MKKIFSAVIILSCFVSLAHAQKPDLAHVDKVIKAEDDFNKLVARKGIKSAFLEVADIEGIVFKPQPVKIVDFYSNIDKQPGTLSWNPKFARISANGDLAFTAGPYVYQNGKTDDDKVYGDYVSIWRTDENNKLKLLMDLGIQHPEPEQEAIVDFKEPDSSKLIAPSKDPFNGKSVILATDKIFNHSLSISTLASYKEFLSPEGRYYFPGFEPIIGKDKIMKFVDNEAIGITAETVDAGRSTSNDLAYSYGTARITKGQVVSNYNYVRIWEIDNDHKWNILLEIFSAVEND
ncbi:nuclear transport factor 2 family protein [Mucilaginibacter sp.]